MKLIRDPHGLLASHNIPHERYRPDEKAFDALGPMCVDNDVLERLIADHEWAVYSHHCIMGGHAIYGIHRLAEPISLPATSRPYGWLRHSGNLARQVDSFAGGAVGPDPLFMYMEANEAIVDILVDTIKRPIEVKVSPYAIPLYADRETFLLHLYTQPCSSDLIATSSSGGRSAFPGIQVLAGMHECVVVKDKAEDGSSICNLTPNSALITTEWPNLASITQREQIEGLRSALAAIAKKYKEMEETEWPCGKRHAGHVVASNLRRRSSEIRGRLSNMREELRVIERSYSSKLRDIRRMSGLLEDLVADALDPDSLEIPSVPLVNRITPLSDSLVLIETDPLSYRSTEGTDVVSQLGSFAVLVNIDTMQINPINLDRMVDGMDSSMNAPHVWENGRACLGNAGYLFTKALGEGDIGGLVTLILIYLQSVNQEDAAGRHFPAWPTLILGGEATTSGAPMTEEPEAEDAEDDDDDEDDEEDDEDAYEDDE